MAQRTEPAHAKHPTSVERKSDREVVVRRVFDAPARLVFEAWTRPELFRQWWVPKSIGLVLLSLDQDVRVGGAYRLVFDLGNSKNGCEQREHVIDARQRVFDDCGALLAVRQPSFQGVA